MLSGLVTVLQSLRSGRSFHRASSTGLPPPELPSRPLDRPIFWGSTRLDDEIGRGAFGYVYRGWSSKLERNVALKLFSSDSGQLEEARRLAAVQHPNVVTIHDYAIHDGIPGIEMELVRGRTLADLVAVKGPLPPKEIARIGIDLGQAVAALHGAEVLHRDVKAQNVMIEDRTKRVVLMDLGLGMRFSGADTDRELAGTLPYIAPEIFFGAVPTAGADIYSLGVLLFFIASGRFPVEAGSRDAYRAAHLRRGAAALKLRTVSRRLPGRLAAIIERAIDWNPQSRHASALQLAQDLERFARRPRLGIWVAPALAGLAAIASAVTFRTDVQRLDLTQLTTDGGLTFEPNISLNGKHVAYASDLSGRGDLDVYVRTIDGGTVRRVTAHTSDEHETAISPDGTLVAYRSERDGGAVYVNCLEGNCEKLIGRHGRTPRFSPDGRALLYWVGDEGNLSRPSGKVFIASIDGLHSREFASSFADARYPSWSPDGREILFQGTPAGRDPELDADWWIAAVDGGSARATGGFDRLRAQDLSLYIGPPFWYGQYLYFSAHSNHATSLWKFRIAGWQLTPRRVISVTSSTEENATESFSSDGRMVFAGQAGKAIAWLMPIDPSGRPLGSVTRLANGTGVFSQPMVSRDSQALIFARRVGTSRRLVVLASSGKTTFGKELMDLPVPLSARSALSSNGKRFAFSQRIDRETPILIADVGNDKPAQVCSDCGKVLTWSPDGKSILFTAGSKVEVRALDLATHQVSTLISDPDYAVDDADISPDGRWVTFLRVETADASTIFTAPIRDGKVGASYEWIRITNEAGWHDKPRWTADGTAIVFSSVRDDFSCFWRQPLDTEKRPEGPLRSQLHWHEARFSIRHLSRPAFNLSISKNLLVFSSGDVVGNLWSTFVRD